MAAASDVPAPEEAPPPELEVDDAGVFCGGISALCLCYP